MLIGAKCRKSEETSYSSVIIELSIMSLDHQISLGQGGLTLGTAIVK
jgi:hypothetical protein